MKEEEILELISRQMSGDIDSTQLHRLRQWYDESESHRKAYKDYCVILKGTAIERDRHLFDSSMEESWRSVAESIAPRARQMRMYTLLRYAAVVTIAVILGWGAGWLHYSGDVVAADVVVEVPNGSKSCVTLPDGSVVWLNSGTRMTYDADFGNGERRVTLDGEGFFNVAKNKHVPFIVTAGTTSIKVLGTRFNMKAYLEDPCKRVTLIEGSVAVTVDGRQQIMTPNQQAVISGSKIMLKNVVAPNFCQWTATTVAPKKQKAYGNDGQQSEMTVPDKPACQSLIFDNEPLSQIVRDLGRTFNVEIQIGSDIADDVFYGDFRNGESLYHVLDVIAAGCNAEYKIDNGKIIMYKVKAKQK